VLKNSRPRLLESRQEMVIRVAIRGQSEVAAASRVRDDDEVVSRESYVYSSSFKKVEPR
jgi:head-tail adaptor